LPLPTEKQKTKSAENCFNSNIPSGQNLLKNGSVRYELLFHLLTLRGGAIVENAKVINIGVTLKKGFSFCLILSVWQFPMDSLSLVRGLIYERYLQNQRPANDSRLLRY
jgi:hypothetical protein